MVVWLQAEARWGFDLEVALGKQAFEASIFVFEVAKPPLMRLAMFQTVTALDFGTIEDSLPPFVTIVLIPLTLSITQGILWGFVAHAGLYALAGRAREVKAATWALASVSIALLAIERLA